jgi:hypothetical protein
VKRGPAFILAKGGRAAHMRRVCVMTIVRVDVKKPPRHRKPSLAAVLKQATQAGQSVKGAVIEPNGKIELTFGEPDPSESTNPWNAEIKKLSKQ